LRLNDYTIAHCEQTTFFSRINSLYLDDGLSKLQS